MTKENLMADKVEGYLEVGLNDDLEIVVNHPDLKPDAEGVGHIVFSANQARHLGELLLRKAAESERDIRMKQETEARKAAEAIPVDRSARVLTDGSPVTEDHREIGANGQQKGYVVLSATERAKGFVRPVRNTYKHNTCGSITSMGTALAETYARDPKFYSGTFCTTCRAHFPLDEFVWAGTAEMLGS
jgi:hypothetical protein